MRKKRQTQKHHSGKTELVGGRVKHKQEPQGKMQNMIRPHCMFFYFVPSHNAMFFLFEREKIFLAGTKRHR